MSSGQELATSAELILSSTNDIVGTVSNNDIYGLSVWRAVSFMDDEKLYTNRDEAIAWLVQRFS